MGGPLIEIAGLCVAYDGVVALDGIDLTVEEGIIGLLGPNGAGKSTLLRSILGHVRPRGGSIRVFGLDVGERFLDIRRRVGYMPENDVTSPLQSAVSFVRFCGELCGMSRTDALERTHRVLNYVGMGDERYRQFETYSLGMRQRVKLAQALIHDPELLFLDEPTNGLDPRGRVEVLRLIGEVAREHGVTVILSTHLLPDVEAICSRVVVIDAGHIVRQDPLERLLDAGRRRFVLGLLGDGEAFAALVEARGGAAEPRSDGKFVVALPALGTPSEFFAIAAEAGDVICHLAPLRRRLEEVFVHDVQPGGGAGEDTGTADETRGR